MLKSVKKCSRYVLIFVEKREKALLVRDPISDVMHHPDENISKFHPQSADFQLTKSLKWDTSVKPNFVIMLSKTKTLH